MELEAFLVSLLLPMLIVTLVNAIIGVAAMGMAKKRGLLPVPAFFAGLFGSFVTLLILAALPEKPQGVAEEGK